MSYNKGEGIHKDKGKILISGRLHCVHRVKKFRHRGNRDAPARRKFKDPKVQQQLVCGTDDDDDKLGNIKFTLFIPFSNLSTIYLSLFSNYFLKFICNNVQRSVQPHDKVLMINATVSNIIQ